MKGNLFIITSPSGGGKGTLLKSILPRLNWLRYSVSFTSRKIREGELDGKDYFFVSEQKFKQKINGGEFLEYAEVHGNFYGTSLKKVEKETNAGNDILLEIDVQGAQNVQKKLPSAIGIFILPPSYKVLSKRLIERNTECKESLALRLNNAKKEVKEVDKFDYIVINDNLNKATEDLKAIFLAEKLKRDRQMYHIQDILNSFENY